MTEERKTKIEPEPSVEKGINTEETIYNSEDLAFLYSSAYEAEFTVLTSLGLDIANKPKMDFQKVCAENMWLKYESEVYPRVLPAIAISEKFTPNTPTASSSDISYEHLLRQGIVVRAKDDPTLYFYIGGISPCWAPSPIYVFHGGTVFRGVISAKLLEGYKSTRVGAIPMIKMKFEEERPWCDPPNPYKIKGAQLAFLSTYQWYNSLTSDRRYIIYKETHGEKVPENLGNMKIDLIAETNKNAFLLPLIVVPSSVSYLADL